jgi:hypothetical protein
MMGGLPTAAQACQSTRTLTPTLALTLTLP